MTELSPGPWTYDAPEECVKDAHGAWLADCCGTEADGRAMASAHEALAVLEELAMPEDKLQMAYTQATGQLVGALHSAAWRRYQAWVWHRNDVLRNKAAAVLEKAGVKP